MDDERHTRRKMSLYRQNTPRALIDLGALIIYT